MTRAHYDKVAIGETLTCPPFRFSEEDIIAFCKIYDPQYFHTDPVKAKKSHFGGLVASGWQTAAMAINRIIATHFPFPDGVTGLGLDHVRWKTPVRPEDDLITQLKVTEKRLSASNPGWGIAVLDIRVTNQKGQLVMEMQTSVMIRAE